MNLSAAKQALAANYGHKVGNMLNNASNRPMVGDGTLTHVMAYTCAACDARMSGAPIQVMSNSGSGNQGIAATVPVAIYARDHKVEHETFVRALALSNLTAIYIKQSLGRLSALCGCIVASTGTCCAITYMMGGSFTQIGFAVKNMIANLTGMICDGAKPGCSLKISSGVGTAMLSAMLAMQNSNVSSLEGIIDEDVDRSIHNLTSIGREAMQETNRMVVDIMTSK
jgi:L-cysteine desulfidase